MVQGQYPQISHGLGKLTPDVWRRLMDLLRNYEQFNRDERSTPSGGRSPTANQFLATIDDHAAVAGAYNIYRYSWTEVKLHNDTVTEKTGGRSGLKTDATTGALNLCELANTEDNVCPAVDVDSDTSQYPEGFSMRAIASFIDDAELLCVVCMYEILDSVGTKRWVFSLANSHDGECE